MLNPGSEQYTAKVVNDFSPVENWTAKKQSPHSGSVISLNNFGITLLNETNNCSWDHDLYRVFDFLLQLILRSLSMTRVVYLNIFNMIHISHIIYETRRRFAPLSLHLDPCGFIQDTRPVKLCCLCNCYPLMHLLILFDSMSEMEEIHVRAEAISRALHCVKGLYPI